MIVVEGTVVTVTSTLAIPGGGAGALPGGGVEDLRQTLSAEARSAFDSNAVLVDTVTFVGVTATSATAVVRVVTQGVAQIGGDGFAAGITSFAGAAADAVAAYARQCVGGLPAVVEATITDAQLGTGALKANTAVGTAPSAASLSPPARRVARLISALFLVLITVVVLFVLGDGGAVLVLAGILAAVVVLVLEFAIEGRVPA